MHRGYLSDVILVDPLGSQGPATRLGCVEPDILDSSLTGGWALLRFTRRSAGATAIRVRLKRNSLRRLKDCS